MRVQPFATAIVVLIAVQAIGQNFQYPATVKKPVVDTYFNTTVTDSYRWLEDVKSQQVKDWLKAQSDYTNSFLNNIPGRDALIEDFKKLDKIRPASIGGITMENNRYFYKKTLGGESVGKIYFRNGKTGKEILLFDPLTYKKGKTMSVSYFVPSRNGKKLAIGVAEGGAEISTIRIMDVDTKKFYPESIYPSWFGVSGWTEDNKGFIYTAQKSSDVSSMEMLQDARVLYHIVGTDSKNDKLIFSRDHDPGLEIKPEDICFVVYSEDYKYVLGILGGVNQDMNCYYAHASELLKEKINWKRLLKQQDEVVNIVIKNGKAYMVSHKDAPNFKVLTAPIEDFDIAKATILIPEEKHPIQYITPSKNFLLIVKSDGINSYVDQYELTTGKLKSLKLPLSGTAGVFTPNYKSDEVLVSMTSWIQPRVLYEYNPVTVKTKISNFHIPVVYPGVENLIAEEMEAPGHDSVMVPLSVIYRKNVKKDGSEICYLSGYGAYGFSATPGFNIINLALLNRGIVIAVAHVRGGGEKGDNWYKAGYKTTKYNTWKDFISCAEYLVKNKYTSAGKIIGMGTSAGGILIGRAITERPDLFAAAISNVSCSNSLRFENTPNGLNNAREFGTVKDSVECMALLEMDALQHVKDGTKYPAVICVGGMNDPRVIVWQPAKFAAALQNASTSGKPVLLQVNYDNGHFTEDKSVAWRNFANMFSFGLWQVGHLDFQPKKAF